MFNLSCFREYKPDNDAQLKKCFDFDWNLTKLEKLLAKDPDDMENL
jgi:hypothetical protein